MPFKTPSFWYKKPSAPIPLETHILRPFSGLYVLASKIHRSRKDPRKANIPVICVGNLSAGGTGKTPTCLGLVQLIRETGNFKKPCFLIRGYGGAERGPLLVNPDRHTSWDVGDEALVLAKTAPTIMSVDRYSGAKLAESQGADLIIMDDGMQNPSLYKDINLVVINGEMGFGNEFVIPAGPLREPLDQGLKRADAFLLIGDDKMDVHSKIPNEKPIFHAHLQVPPDRLPPKTNKYVAFAGLGYPEKFFSFLSNGLGYEIATTKTFADHYPYERSDLQDLRKLAQDHDATLITTEKDYIRLPRGFKDDIMVLPVEMQFSDKNLLSEFLIKKTSDIYSGHAQQS